MSPIPVPWTAPSMSWHERLLILLQGMTSRREDEQTHCMYAISLFVTIVCHNGVEQTLDPYTLVAGRGFSGTECRQSRATDPQEWKLCPGARALVIGGESHDLSGARKPRSPS